MSPAYIKVRSVSFRKHLAWFSIVILPVVVLIVVVAGVLYSSEIGKRQVELVTFEKKHVEEVSEAIISRFNTVASDLLVLSKHYELQKLVNGDKADKKFLTQEFLAFADIKGVYDQARYLDETGQEIVRVNYSPAGAYVVSQDKLQNKADRYYFLDTMELSFNEIFVSPFDLNVENGQIEQPYKPMIRFATPIINTLKEKKGIVITNYLGQDLFDRIEKSVFHQSDLGETLLINNKGYWLKGMKPEDEWGFMFDDERRDNSFEKSFPLAWQIISRQDSGQFENSEGLFTFKTIYPLRQLNQKRSKNTKFTNPNEYYWQIVSYESPQGFVNSRQEVFKLVFIPSSILLLLISIVTWLLVGSILSRNDKHLAS